MENLRSWLEANNGHLHAATELRSDGGQGCYLVAKEDLQNGAQIMSVPHSMFLSCLNAMVDDSLPVLKANADSFTVEALGVLYLMSQWLNKDTSFWKPYLDILPTPEQGFNTPFWFDEDDLLWLRGTDLANSFEALEAAWKKYWRDDTKVLDEGGMDVSQYTWTLCKWAATVYNSRSLSSRAVTPQDSKYWTAYKQGPRGRQTVLLDFSRVPQTRKDFPVLVPIMDCLNHNPTAKVDWGFEPGRFTLTLHEDVKQSAEVFNNYGPKSSSELLMGYGFCVEGNPHDCVFETLKPPPRELQKLLRVVHPGYFTTMGLWHSDAATFRLSAWSADSGEAIWDSIPLPLVELFYYIVIFERGLPVAPIEGDLKDYLLSGSGRHTLPRIAFYIVSSLMPKINKITELGAGLPEQPSNMKQHYARIYRDGQLSIMHSLRQGLLIFNRSFRPPREINGPEDVRALELKPYFFTIDEALQALATYAPLPYEQIVRGLVTAFSVNDIDGLQDPAIEQHVWVLYLCTVVIIYNQILSNTERDWAQRQMGILGYQIRSLIDEYDGDQYKTSATDTLLDSDQEDPEADFFMGLVNKARTAFVSQNTSIPDYWKSPMWSRNFVLDWGLRIARSQGMNMRVTDDKVRYVVYLHLDHGSVDHDRDSTSLSTAPSDNDSV